MIDLDTGMLIAGAVALVLSAALTLISKRLVLGALRSHPEELDSSLLLRVVPKRELLPAGAAVTALAGLFYVALPESGCGIAFLTGALSLLLTAGFLVRPAGLLSVEPIGIEGLSGKLERLNAGACGSFIAGMASLSQGLLCLIDTGEAPDLWAFFGGGALAALLIGWGLSRFGPSAWRRSGRVWMDAPVRKLLWLYAAFIFTFSIAMAMGSLAGDEIEDWVRIPQSVALSGTVVSLVFGGFYLSMGGKGRRIWLALSVLILGAIGYLTVQDVMSGLPSQSLISTGMMDRMGPFWAMTAGLITALLARSLYRYYTIVNLARIGLSFFLITDIWISYTAAGFYGIALSASAGAGLLPLILTVDLGGVRRDATAGYAASVFLLCAAGIASYFLLHFV